MLPYYFLQCQFYTAAMDQLAELSSSMREIAIWTPVATELSASGVNVTGLRWWPEHRCLVVLRADLKNGCPDHSSRCDSLKSPKCSIVKRAYSQNLQPFTGYVTSLFQWKILSRDRNNRQNKQTSITSCGFQYLVLEKEIPKPCWISRRVLTSPLLCFS